MINQLVSVMIFGVGNAALTVVGNTIGRGRVREGQAALGHAAGAVGRAGALFGGGDAGARAGGHLLLQLLRGDDLDRRGITRVGALIVFFQSLAITGMVGILRAGGDAKFVLICETAFLWGGGRCRSAS